MNAIRASGNEKELTLARVTAAVMTKTGPTRKITKKRIQKCKNRSIFSTNSVILKVFSWVYHSYFIHTFCAKGVS